jgi:hypothetical protein
MLHNRITFLQHDRQIASPTNIVRGCGLVTKILPHNRISFNTALGTGSTAIWVVELKVRNWPNFAAHFGEQISTLYSQSVDALESRRLGTKVVGGAHLRRQAAEAGNFDSRVRPHLRAASGRIVRRHDDKSLHAVYATRSRRE